MFYRKLISTTLACLFTFAVFSVNAQENIVANHEVLSTTDSEGFIHSTLVMTFTNLGSSEVTDFSVMDISPSIDGMQAATYSINFNAINIAETTSKQVELELRDQLQAPSLPDQINFIATALNAVGERIELSITSTIK